MQWINKDFYPTKDKTIEKLISDIKIEEITALLEPSVGKANIVDYIVEKSIEYKLGARGLRGIVENIMMEIMFNAPMSEKKDIVVTLDYAKEQLIKANMDHI